MEQKLTFKDWLIATRPWSFTASAMSVIVVLVYQQWLTGGVDWLNGVLAVVGIILFHAAGNTWSDYCDYTSGVDTVEGAYAVPTLTSGQFNPKQIRSLALALLVAGCGVGLYLLLTTGLTLLWIGLGGIFCALCYPPLKYRALGDAVILAAYCLLPAIGASYVAVGEIDWRVLLAALPVGLLVDSILHSNNTRDMTTDRKAKIQTMAMGMGIKWSIALYIFEQLFPYVWVIALIPFGVFPWISAIVIFVMKMGVQNCRTMREFKEEGDSAKIAMLDQRSAQSQMLFAIVLSLSLLLDMLLR